VTNFSRGADENYSRRKILAGENYSRRIILADE